MCRNLQEFCKVHLLKFLLLRFPCISKHHQVLINFHLQTHLRILSYVDQQLIIKLLEPFHLKFLDYLLILFEIFHQLQESFYKF